MPKYKSPLKATKVSKKVKKGEKKKKRTEAQMKKRQERLERKAAPTTTLLSNISTANSTSNNGDESGNTKDISAPMRKQVTHAKWSAVFKRHIGLIESHMKQLDRVTQNMRTRMGEMDPEERGMWERGEVGNWLGTCAMVDRSKQMLADAREAARIMAPETKLDDKKVGLGIKDSKPEPLQYAQPLGATNGKPASGDDTSKGSDEEEDSAPAEYIPLNISAKMPRMTGNITKDKDGDTEMSDAEDVVEPNPYFVVDTEPTPVNLAVDGTGKKERKRSKEGDNDDTSAKEAKKARKAKKYSKEKPTAVVSESESGPGQVDFISVEAKLKAEVEAGLKAKQELEDEKAKTKDLEATLGKKEKKRKRHSAGDGDAEKEVKKAKKDKTKKRTVDESSTGEQVMDEGKKKKRKHKTDV